MSFLVILKSPKVGKEVEKIGLSSFNWPLAMHVSYNAVLVLQVESSCEGTPRKFEGGIGSRFHPVLMLCSGSHIGGHMEAELLYLRIWRGKSA